MEQNKLKKEIKANESKFIKTINPQQHTYNDPSVTGNDILQELNGLKDEEEKKNAEQILAAFITKYTFYFQQIEKRYLARGKKKYYLGDYFSLADIFITVMIMSFYNIVKEKRKELIC